MLCFLVDRQAAKEASMRGHKTGNGISAASGTVEPLRPENQHLLAFLDELTATPDDKGPTWWEEFRSSLKTTQLRLGPPPAK